MLAQVYWNKYEKKRMADKNSNKPIKMKSIQPNLPKVLLIYIRCLIFHNLTLLISFEFLNLLVIVRQLLQKSLY